MRVQLVHEKMATTASLSQVLSEARILVTKLHDREKLADKMLSDGQSLNEKISCMKEYKEDMHELNDVCHQQPRSALVHSLQQENRQIRQLQEENRELKSSLEDHQTALELIMQRHRKLMHRIMQLSAKQNLAEQVLKQLQQGESHAVQLSQVREFAGVFDSCLRLGEEASHRDQQEMAQLRTENSVLRQLLRIGAPNDREAARQFCDFVKDSHKPDASSLSESVVEQNGTPDSEEDVTPSEETLSVGCSKPEVPKPAAESEANPEKSKTAVNGNNNTVASSPPPKAAPKTIKRTTSAGEQQSKRPSITEAKKPALVKRKSVETKTTDGRGKTGALQPKQPVNATKMQAIKS